MADLIKAIERCASPAASRPVPARPSALVRDRGFTLVEVTTSVAVMLVVLTAAWTLLLVSNSNLSTIENGGQSSEINRAAMAYFERDLGHAVLPMEDISPVLRAASRSISFMADTDRDGDPEMVTWRADDSAHRLLRVVTRTPDATRTPVSYEDFTGGVSTTETVLSGLAPRQEMLAPPMFVYGVDATNPYDPEHDSEAGVRRIGLVTLRIRNGLPDYSSHITDRSGTFRILALVINGY
jgi:prepilin-type N-terminal cleavage/methylation domain-containing protein